MSKNLIRFCWICLIVCFVSTTSLKASWSGMMQASSSYLSVSNGMDSEGNTIVVWTEFDGVNTKIQSAFLPKGGLWITLGTISSFSGESVGVNPNVAVNADGTAVAVWEESINESYSTVKASMLLKNRKWTLPVALSAPSLTYTGKLPQIALNSSGLAVAVWLTNNNFINTVQAATLHFGGYWSAPVNLSPLSSDINNPQISLDNDGNAIAIWYDKTQQAVQTACLSQGKTWSPPTTLSDNVTYSLPQVSMNPSGYAVATWEKSNGSYFSIQSSTKLPGGAWSTPVEISTHDFGAYSSKVAVDVNNHAVAVWEQQTEKDSMNNAIIQASYLPFGGNWTAPVNLSATNGRSLAANVAFDHQGNAYAIWNRDDYTDQNYDKVQAAILPVGGIWSAAETLSGNGNMALPAKISVDSTGYAVVNWPDGISVESALWTPAPVVTNITPNFGPSNGGNTITITGTNFIGVYFITFGTSISEEFSVISPSEITVVVPSGSGKVDVQVVGLQNSSKNEFTHYTYQ